MLTVDVTTPIRPTEDRAKVFSALRSLFPEGELSDDGAVVCARSASLDNFSELVRRQRILDATRATLRRGINANSTAFVLNKQAAAVGNISFEEGRQPLGGISVRVTADSAEELESVIDRVAPRTVNGEVPI